MMGDSVGYILSILFHVTSLVGFLVNLIIVAANFLKWKRNNSLQTCDKIISSLAISRVLFIFNIIIRNGLFQFFPRLLQTKIISLFLYSLTMFLYYTSHWFAAILCVFYCVKIVTYNYKLFVFLKTRISTMVPWIILNSLLISLISSLPFHWFGYDLKLQNSSNVSTENMTKNGHVIDYNFTNQFLVFVAGSFPPLLIFCFANFLLIHFLLIHTRRMSGVGSHNHSPNLKSHFCALKSMSLFLVLQIIFFICMSLFASGIFYHLKYSFYTFWIILCSSPLFHSLYIIYSSSELRKPFLLKCLGSIGCS
ncbi:taste receptor type 2 member 40-like [Phyllobates terribilis]|uniref:taste receptor type 2 member 40-like n=1 Tax=Phyllobates terribilis TaxID=111132 RepID=UPI003CCB3C4C